MADGFIVHVVLLACLLPLVWGVCQDLDATSCQGLLAQNANLCHEEVFSNTACPRTCGKCALTCYHCDNPVSSYEDCTTTKTCNYGEKCMLTYVSSSEDGHSEYRMSCATNEMCDGKIIFFGRRDISTHCCSDDLCNSTPTTTTSTTTTTTTTPVPTTTVPECTRDIIILVEDSQHGQGDTYIKFFLTDLTSSMKIDDRHANAISLSTFDSSVHHRLSIEHHQNNSYVAEVIKNLTFYHYTDSVDYRDVVREVTRYIDEDNRDDFDLHAQEVVIVLSDHASNATGYEHYHSIEIARGVRNFIVINVGPLAVNHSGFAHLATSSEFVLNLQGYADLLGITNKVLQLICR